MELAGASVVVFLVNQDFRRHAISWVAISITDTYNPDTDVRMVFNGKVHTIRRLAVERWRRLLGKLLVYE